MLAHAAEVTEKRLWSLRNGRRISDQIWSQRMFKT